MKYSQRRKQWKETKQNAIDNGKVIREHHEMFGGGYAVTGRRIKTQWWVCQDIKHHITLQYC